MRHFSLNRIFDINVRHWFIFFYAFLIHTSFLSCDYSPNNEFYNELDSVVSPQNLHYSLDITNNDTIYFYKDQDQYINIRLNFEDTLKVFEIKCFIDDSVINSNYVIDSNTIILRLNIEDAAFHTFSFNIYTSLGTNSIADNLGYEGFFVFESKEYAIQTNIEYSYHYGEYSVNEDDFMTLSWKEFNGCNFDYYVIKNSITNKQFKSSSNSYVDSLFYGEYSHYDIYVVDKNGWDSYWASIIIKDYMPVPFLSERNKELTISWEINDILKKWDSSSIVQISESGQGIKDIAYLPIDSTYVVLKDYKIGDYVTIYLSIIPKIEKSPVGNRSSITLHLGIPSTTEIFYPESLAPIGFIMDNGKIYKATDDSFIDSPFGGGSFTRSTNGKYAMVSDFVNVYIYQFEGNYKLLKTLAINRISDENYINWPFLSDDGVLSFWNNTKYLIYDLINEKKVTEKTFSIYKNSRVLSGSKTYLFFESNQVEIYELENDSLLLKKEMTIDGAYMFDFIKLLPDNPKQFYYFKDGTIVIRNVDDLSVDRTISLHGNNFINIDLISNKVLTTGEYNSKEKYFFVYDFYSGELLHSIPIAFNAGEENSILCNDIIFCQFFSSFKYYLK
jgi:hypothetical protein